MPDGISDEIAWIHFEQIWEMGNSDLQLRVKKRLSPGPPGLYNRHQTGHHGLLCVCDQLHLISKRHVPHDHTFRFPRPDDEEASRWV